MTDARQDEEIGSASPPTRPPSACDLPLRGGGQVTCLTSPPEGEVAAKRRVGRPNSLRCLRANCLRRSLSLQPGSFTKSRTTSARSR